MNLFSLPACFYPTPPALVGKMLDCVDFKHVTEILEPSAGDGAIAWGIAERVYDHNRCVRSYDEFRVRVDCIEIDENLRALLRHRFGPERQKEVYDKLYDLDTVENRRNDNPELYEYKRLSEACSFPVFIIHDDFFTYRCAKQYDLVVMNPPFENGDMHLHRALDIMQYGGQIICLLNAETIRNRYTKSRQVLWARLNDLEAQIQFLTGEFETGDTQRKTAVEVALIYIKIPPVTHPSFIFDGLKKAKEEARCPS